MNYWNKSNLEGLLELAGELNEVPELGALSEYCILRERGLRARAFEQLDSFLNTAELWPPSLARRNVLTILQADARSRQAHKFIAHPLLSRLVFPTLEHWKEEEPSSVEPLRWLGLLRSESDALERTLSLMPSDVPVRRKLINLALDVADYSTHHLSESTLLGSVEEARESIATASFLISSAPDIKPFDDLLAEAKEYEQMLDDWETYNASPAGTFPEWCEKHGRTYSWPTIVYYDD